MHFLQLEYCKLQAGCLVLILYLAFIYYKERKRFHLAGRRTLYDWLLAEEIACLLLDGITVCTVNHQELVNAGLNLVLHGMFLISIDGLIFLLLLYMLDTTEGLPVQLQKRLLLAMKELSRYHDEMVMGFATLIENRDSSTGGHVKRTTRYVELLVGELKKRGYYSDILSRDYINNLLKAAPMHDIGKIAVPDAVLQKPGRLSPEEFEIMKQHTSRGGEMIQETFGRMGDEQFLEIVTQIARYHHEKWNGRGYPEGLKRKEIPLCARIMAIADVFDAVSADRCYRAALPLEKCFEIIQDGSGQDFDPILAEIFLDLREEVRKVKEGRNETEKYTYRCEGY